MSNKNLPQVKFKTNIPIDVVLPYGDAKQIPSKYEGKQQYLYTAEVDGDAHVLFATEALHAQLAQVGKGGKARIVKAEVENEKGGSYTQFEVDVLEQGTPVAQPQGNQTASPGPSAALGGSAQVSATPGSRAGVGERLGQLGAAYAACLDQARAVWMRSGVAKVPPEVLGPTATTFFIQLNREAFDLAELADDFSESKGQLMLRQLIERVQREPHLSDVHEAYRDDIASPPGNPADQRHLYAQLTQAMKTATELAAEATTPPEDEPEEPPQASSEFPPEDDLPETLQEPKRPEQEAHRNIRQLAEEVYEGVGDPKFIAFLSKVTKKTAPDILDLTLTQAKAVERSLQAMRDSVSA